MILKITNYSPLAWNCIILYSKFNHQTWESTRACYKTVKRKGRKYRKSTVMASLILDFLFVIRGKWR